MTGDTNGKTAPRRFLVTGGTGFLGQHLVRQLLELEHEVVVLARGRDRALERLGAEFHVGSVTEESVCVAACEGVDGVFHLAGRVERDLKRSHVLHHLHTTGTRSIIRGAAEAGVHRVVYASTSGVVGVSKDSLHVANDNSDYATDVVKDWPYYLSKVYAEKTAFATARSRDVELVVMRPTLLLGPGDDRLSSTRDVRQFLDGKIPFVPTGGLSFVDVRDTAAAFITAMDEGRDGATYLLGSANLTMEAFFERLESISGVGRPIVTVPDQLAQVGARAVHALMNALGRSADIDPISVEMSQHFWYIDWSAAIEELGFSPRDPGQTLYDTVQWLQDNPEAGRQAKRTTRTPAAQTNRPWNGSRPVAPQHHDAAYSAPARDAYGEPVVATHNPAPYAGHTGQSRIAYETMDAEGPGLESIVGSTIGRALRGVLGGGRRAQQTRRRIDERLDDASPEQLEAALRALEDIT